jgi:hypothetical protein
MRIFDPVYFVYPEFNSLGMTESLRTGVGIVASLVAGKEKSEAV